MMKKIKLIALPVLFVLGSIGFVQASTSCAEKRAVIEEQIQQAKMYGNTHEENNLQIALDKINSYCTPESIRNKVENNITKIERKIIDKQNDIINIKASLEEANLQGNIKKITKYQVKLTEKEADITKLNSELAILKEELIATKA